jgi:protein-L-isoaspartate O-methyltransferase
MTRENIVEKINKLDERQKWNHSIELTPGVFTTTPNRTSAGKNLVKWELMRGFLEAFGCEKKRILDVGCNDGFFSMKLAEFGADVIALEANSDRIEKARFVFEVMGVDSKINLVEKNIFEISKNELGHFDLILCTGFIHRIPDPYSLFEKLSEMSSTILVEFKAFQEFAYDRTYLVFDGKRSDPNDPYSTCYFIPSVKAVVKMLKNIGMENFALLSRSTDRRVMLVSSKNDIPGIINLKSLKPPGKMFMLKKYTRRFISDIIKTIGGEFS